MACTARPIAQGERTNSLMPILKDTPSGVADEQETKALLACDRCKRHVLVILPFLETQTIGIER
jgi:hypothetical protein